MRSLWCPPHTGDPRTPGCDSRNAAKSPGASPHLPVHLAAKAVSEIDAESISEQQSPRAPHASNIPPLITSYVRARCMLFSTLVAVYHPSLSQRDQDVTRRTCTAVLFLARNPTRGDLGLNVRLGSNIIWEAVPAVTLVACCPQPKQYSNCTCTSCARTCRTFLNWFAVEIERQVSYYVRLGIGVRRSRR